MARNDVALLFGRRLRALRKTRGFTQQELGSLADVGYKFIGGIERGEENPSLEVIARLAAALEVELAELFELAAEETSPAKLRKQVAELTKSGEVAELQRAVRLLRALRSS